MRIGMSGNAVPLQVPIEIACSSCSLRRVVWVEGVNPGPSSASFPCRQCGGRLTVRCLWNIKAGRGR